MKKTLSIILIIILSLSMISCEKKMSIEETVTYFLDGIKVSRDITDVYDHLLDINYKTIDLGLGENANEAILDATKDYIYEITDIVEEEDKGTVTIHFTNYNLLNALYQGLTNYLTEGLPLAPTELTDEEAEIFFEESMDPYFEDVERDFEIDATITLTKVDDKWMIDYLYDNTDFYDGITGGMFSVLSDITSLKEGTSDN